MSKREELELLAEWLGIDITGAWYEGPVEGLFIPSLDDYWNPLTNDTDFLNMVAGRVDFSHSQHAIMAEIDGQNHRILKVARLNDHNNDKLAAMKHAAIQVCLMAAREGKK